MTRFIVSCFYFCAAFIVVGANGLAGDAEHWSFVPPRRPVVPHVSEAAWARNPIDAFILARLEEQKIPHGVRADRATLLRRLSFDLLGLPPARSKLLHSWVTDPRMPTSIWSIGYWRARTTASDGASTGLIWRGTPKPTASSLTRPVPMHGAIATGWSRR